MSMVIITELILEKIQEYFKTNGIKSSSSFPLNHIRLIIPNQHLTQRHMKTGKNNTLQYIVYGVKGSMCFSLDSK